jgi:hypothetical protein
MAEEDGIELVSAAATGIVALAEDCLARGISVHAGNDLPLRTAALMGNAEMIRFLVDKGADVTAAGSEALLYAAKRQDEDTVAFLLSKGADIGEMMKQHRKSIDQDVLDILDRHQSSKLREAFEKNFARLKKPPKDLRLPKAPKP